MKVCFRTLKEKVKEQTLTGDEQFEHVFHATTPSDVAGAKKQITVVFYSLFYDYLFVILRR